MPATTTAIQIPKAITHEGSKSCFATCINLHGFRSIDVWPTVAAGDEVEISNDCNGYSLQAVVTHVRSETTFEYELRSKTPLPLPPVVIGKPYCLPNMSGHGHLRNWGKGYIVQIQGEYYRVRTAKIETVGRVFTLAPATKEQFAKRKGRTLLKKQRDEVQFEIGHCVQAGDEWLEIKDIERATHRSGEGDEVFGHSYYGIGNFVTEARAKTLNARWQLHADVRRLELDLKAATGSESMCDAADIRKIQGELEAARTKAGGR